MSHIYKPKNEKKYKIVFSYRGKKYHRSLRVASLKDARILQARIDFDIAQGTLNPATLLPYQKKLQTVNDMFEAFLKSAALSEKKPASIERYGYAIRRVAPIIGEMRTGDLTRRYVKNELTQELTRQGVTTEHRRTIFIHMRAIWYWLIDEDEGQGVTDNPFARNVPAKVHRLPKYYERGQIEEYKEWLSDQEERFRVYFTLLLNAPLRKTEAWDLEWSNVQLEELVLRYYAKRHDRIVEITQETADILASFRVLGKDRVFWNIASTSILDKFHRKAQKEFPWMGRIHDFKSNWATWFMKNGGDIHELMRQCGWKDLQTAMVYVNFSPRDSSKIRGKVQF